MNDFKIHHVEQTSSTNTDILEYIACEEGEGFVLWADFQLTGRGQFNREWASPKGKDLLFSVYLEPQIKPQQAISITRFACLAAQKVLSTYGIEAEIKEPNDLMIRDKKICGILTESVTSQSGYLEHVVIGYGLNVNSETEEIHENGISMKMLTGITYDREEILKKVLPELKSQLETTIYQLNNTDSQKSINIDNEVE